METIRIKTEFKIGETVFIAKKKFIEEECPLCQGEKNIVLKIKGGAVYDYMCPHCSGMGKVKLKKVYAPVEEMYVVTEIKFTLKENNEIITKIKGMSLNTGFVKDSSEVFKTLNECKEWCDEMNLPREVVSISDIIISDEFKEHTPSFDKIQFKMEEYRRTGKMNEIAINKDNILVDGYITYKMCQLLDIKEVTVKVV